MIEDKILVNNYLNEIIKIRTALPEEETFSANIVVGRLAFFYEKMRNTLEYKDEHLILKSALERILKRKFKHYIKGQELGKEILSEMIAGGYINNGEIPISVIDKIDSILSRYYDLLQILGSRIKKDINSLIACAIEEKFKKEVLEDEALILFAFSDTKNKVKADIVVDQNKFEQELYISLHRNILKSDYQTIRYRFLKMAIPNLEDSYSDIHSISALVEQRNADFDALLKSSIKTGMLKLSRKLAPAYLIIGKIIKDTSVDNIVSLFSNPDDMRHKVDVTYSKWRESAYGKISSAAIKSVMFILFTKMVLAFIVELPYEIFVLRRINYIALGINLLFPPLYMFLSTFTISVPGRENLILIQSAVKKILFEDGEEYIARLKTAGSLKKTVFFLVYLLTFCFSFGLLSWGLIELDFSVVAGILFFVFFSTVSFFAYRISNISKDLVILKQRGTIKDAIFDFFSLPFIKLGQLLSSSFSRINIFLFFFDFIVETPFKTLIKFIDEWVGYAREKKDDILNE
jgi:hypothetical protein